MLCMTGALPPSRSELLNRTSCLTRYSARWPAIFGNAGEMLSPLGPWHDAQTWAASLPVSVSCACRDGTMHEIVMSDSGMIRLDFMFVCLVLIGRLSRIELRAIRIGEGPP